MSAPDFNLIGAVMTALRADATVTGLVNPLIIYDPPPQAQDSVRLPYISMGSTDYRRDDADCIDTTEITFQLDVWDQGDTVRCRRICDAIVDALHNKELPLAEGALAELWLELTRVFRDPDNIHVHGVLQFTAVVETP